MLSFVVSGITCIYALCYASLRPWCGRDRVHLAYATWRTIRWIIGWDLFRIRSGLGTVGKAGPLFQDFFHLHWIATRFTNRLSITSVFRRYADRNWFDLPASDRRARHHCLVKGS